MKKLVFILFLAALPFAAFSQIKFGYLSYAEALKAMPGYAIVQKNIASLKEQYDNETKRAENEFNRKYEDFLDGYREFDKPILDKRQSELQELLNSNIAFKKEAARLLGQAEADMYMPLKNKLNAVLKEIAEERGYAFILNTDNDAAPFISPLYGEDISALVREAVAVGQ